MSIRRFWGVLVITGVLLFSTTSALSIGPEAIQTNVFTDIASFEAATGPLTTIDFENLPPSASSDPVFDEAFVPNPLILDGVIFADPFSLQTSFCSSPTCQPDPNNPDGGNIVLALNQGATIDLPVGTGGAMVIVEGMGTMSFTLQVTDFGGDSIAVDGQALLNDVSYLGFTSTSGIQQIEVIAIGPAVGCPQPPCGPLVLSAMLVELDDPGVTIGVWTDPSGDVASSNADIIRGSATVSSKGKVDLRVQFLDPPFLNSETHDITWCLDTDQNAATGSACGLAGADQAFTLSGRLGSLYGHGFYFTGALASLNPCSVGFFNWDTNTLRLIIPLSLLSADEQFNYAVIGTFQEKDINNNIQVHTDFAPGTVDFATPGGFFSSLASDFAPFKGPSLCSFNRSASMTIPIEASGTIELFPELGVFRRAPVANQIQSNYFKTTASNRQFRRGFFEFAIPDFPAGDCIAKATLILTEHRGRTTTPKPPVIHEVSYYQPADLVVDTDDWDRATIPLSQTIETDENLPTQVFTLDVTDVFINLQGDTLGFRIKLAVDPDFSDYGNFGSGFGDSSTAFPPQILIRFCDARAIADSTSNSTLVYTGTQGLDTEVLALAGAVSETTTLVYEVVTLTHDIPIDAVYDVDVLAFSPHTITNGAFIFDAYQRGNRQSEGVFQQPVTVTLHYTDTDVIGLNERFLILGIWNGSNWEYAACGPYDRHPDDNWLAVPVCRPGEFVLFGMAENPRVYLPVVSNSVE